MIELLNIDCMKYMATQADNAFDLAIVDPPYGLGHTNHIGGNHLAKINPDNMSWNMECPSEDYFKDVLRIAKNQIIWGANYYPYPQLKGGRIVWDKDNSGNFSACKLAYSSFHLSIKKFIFRWNGMLQQDMANKEQRIHPTQKPVRLYSWLLENYAKPGQRILDTHLGSGSSAIAAHYFGCDFVGCEIDKDYYTAAKKRFDKETRQAAMF